MPTTTAPTASVPSGVKTVSYTEALSLLRTGKISAITIDAEHYIATLSEGKKILVTGVPGTKAIDQVLVVDQRAHVAVNGNSNLGSNVVRIESTNLNKNSWVDRIVYIVPTLLFGLLLLGLLFTMASPFGREKIKAAKSQKVHFADIGGIGEAVEELQEVKDFLAKPERFSGLGARVPKGVLMYGPPGTGKTLMAKAIASEANVPFFSASGSDFVQMFVGLGAFRVRRMFRKARKSAPSIIFIDEIDTLGATRSQGGDGGSREDNRTLNALLKEMDGFERSKAPVIVIGATNRLDHLDPALLRPGRFDRHIAVDPPDRAGRLEILQLHAKNKKLGQTADLDEIARQTANMSGADLENILNEAAIHAARHNSDTIEQIDLEDALVRVIAGAKKKNRAFSDEEKRIVAYHEAGHAVVGHRLGRNNWVHRISIIPRGMSGGQTFFGEEDIWMPSRERLLNEICTLLGGRAAEEVMFDSVTTGASNDLQRASQIVMGMLVTYGMGKTLGLLAPDQSRLAPEHLERIEAEARQILDEQYERAKGILADDPYFESLAEVLLEVETVDRDAFLILVGAPLPEEGEKLEGEDEPRGLVADGLPSGAAAAEASREPSSESSPEPSASSRPRR